MRRLPIFFLLDVSESMAGENQRKMEEALACIGATLRRDPHALETVYFSVIAFAGIARTIAPLVDVGSFYPPKLPIGSGTSLGAALRHLMAEMDRTVQKTTPDNKGDWRPVIYLLTDGKPTDDVQPATEEWRRKYRGHVDLVAIALGRFADLQALSRLTDHVLIFEDANDGDFTSFIQWITASVTEQSRSAGDVNKAGVQLAKLDSAILRSAQPDLHSSVTVDRDCVVLVGRCQRTRNPYLMKYDRVPRSLQTSNFTLDLSQYQLTGCYPVDESYFTWSDPAGSQETVSSLALLGVPSCPYCGNPSAFAKCGCGRLMCVGGPGVAICPWCDETIEFVAPSVDECGFEVGRGKG